MNEDRLPGKEVLYARFQDSRQEKQKQRAALEYYFAAGEETKQKMTCEEYLGKRIRPVVRQLMEHQQYEQADRLFAAGFVKADDLDELIRTAAERGWISARIWLMQKKDELYGYREKKYDL